MDRKGVHLTIVLNTSVKFDAANKSSIASSLLKDGDKG